MTAAETLNLCGLLLIFIGGCVLFRWGPPQPQLEEGIGIGLEDATRLADGRTVAEHDAKTGGRRQLYSWASKLGLGLIIAGFALQLVGSRPACAILWWGCQVTP